MLLNVNTIFSIGICLCILDSVTSDVSGNLAWNTNLWRQEHLQSICKKLGRENETLPVSANLTHFLVNHEHRLLYCYVPKVACTNWKRLLMILGRKWNTSDIVSIPGDIAHAHGSVIKLSELTETNAKYCLENYTRFVMVRHPFERLLSAYRNKLEGKKQNSSKYFQNRIGKYIIKKYRENANHSSLQTGSDVTFAEFVQYIIREGHDNRDQNEHWKPISQMCYPCSLSYNVIGKYETLVEDSDMVLEMVNAKFMSFPVTKTADTSKKLIKYFRQLSLRQIEQLYRLYEMDFKVFDYGLENVIGFDIG